MTQLQAPESIETERKRRRRRRKTGLARRESRLGLAMILPAVLVVAALVLFPLIWNISLSFQKARLINIRDVSVFNIDPTLFNYETVLGTRLW